MFVVLPLSFDVWVKKNISGDQSHEGLNVTGQGRRFEWLNRGSNRLTQKPGTAIPLFETSIFYEHLRNISETSQKHLRNISETSQKHLRNISETSQKHLRISG